MWTLGWIFCSVGVYYHPTLRGGYYQPKVPPNAFRCNLRAKDKFHKSEAMIVICKLEDQLRVAPMMNYKLGWLLWLPDSCRRIHPSTSVVQVWLIWRRKHPLLRSNTNPPWAWDDGGETLATKNCRTGEALECTVYNNVCDKLGIDQVRTRASEIHVVV